MTLFRNANFRLLFSGRLLTNIGDSLYLVAAMWLVYKLGGSSFYTGLAGFLILLPQALQFLVGPIVDRSQITRLLVFSQIAQAILLMIIPAAYFAGWLTVWLILIVMPLVSFLDQFSFPAENALIPRMIEQKDRQAANSAMSLAYQGTDAAFNAIGGVILVVSGAITLYTADIATFIVAAWLFHQLKLSGKESRSHLLAASGAVKRYFTDLGEGFQLAFHSVLGKVIITGLVTNFALGAEVAVLPAYSDTLGGSKIYGYLLAGAAVGSLAGALSAPQFSRFSFGRLLSWTYLLGFCFWVASYLVPSVGLKILFFSMAMLPLGLSNVTGYTVMQNLLPKNLIARAMSVMVSGATCMMPLGSLAGGIAAEVMNPGTVFLLAGSGFLFVAVYVAVIPVLRKMPSAENLKPEDYGFETRSV